LLFNNCPHKLRAITKERMMKMSNTMFMRVEDVAEEMGVSVSYAYKLIRRLNKELKATGCITIPGRIDRKFFHEKFYSTKTNDERSN
jgi:hypothetical protein